MTPDLNSMIFKRKFAVNFRKNLKLHLAGMTFSSDFINGSNQSMYPVLEEAGSYKEVLKNAHYCFVPEGKASINRLIGQYTPYSTAEMVVERLDGSCGFCYTTPTAKISLLMYSEGGKLSFVKAENGEETEVASQKSFVPGMSFIVDTRKGAFDVFIKVSEEIEYLTSFDAPGFEDAMAYQVFTSSTVAMVAAGALELSDVSLYMDCGLTQADIRPIKYETGEVMIDHGKVYLTISIRQIVGCYQGVFSWIPGTCEFELVGVLFFDAGDGVWENDVASSIRYNRSTGEWYLWVCSFAHHHILGHAAMKGDPRFGVNVVDLKLMDPMAEDEEETAFKGKEGDEDPDFYLDTRTNRWYMTICRLLRDGETLKYRYCLYCSEHPFEGYTFVDCGRQGAETGGSIVPIGDKVHFVCGSDFDKRAIYHVYEMPDFSTFEYLKCDYDDGGFRGWGTIIPCPMGTRMRYYWLTFDRYRASDARWSYGNLYCFEA